MSEITIAPATESDLDAVRQLLLASGLPTAGVEDHWKTFLVARDGSRIIGCGGAEAYKQAVLLRSIAIDAEYQGHGIGRQLVRQLIDRLASRGLREFYLLTTTAEEYFHKRGFKTIDRSELHPQVLQSQELQGACPDTAICMRLMMLS